MALKPLTLWYHKKAKRSWIPTHYWCVMGTFIYIYIYIEFVHNERQQICHIIIFTLNENIPLRDYNIYIKWKYPIEGFPLFGTYMTLAASFNVIAWFKETWFTCAGCMGLWFRNIFNSMPLFKQIIRQLDLIF